MEEIDSLKATHKDATDKFSELESEKNIFHILRFCFHFRLTHNK